MKTKASSNNFTDRLISILDFYLYHIVVKKDYKKSVVDGCIHNVIQQSHLTAA